MAACYFSTSVQASTWPSAIDGLSYRMAYQERLAPLVFFLGFVAFTECTGSCQFHLDTTQL